jgi:transposase
MTLLVLNKESVMPAKRKLTMRQLRQMLRLAGDGTSARDIARTLGVARSTVQDNLKRAAAAGLTWPLPGELTDDALEGKLFARAGVKQGMRRHPEPNWADLVVEMKKPGVTLLILWEEYRAIHPGSYGYSRFCDLYRGFERRLSPTMRQDHAAGDKVFVDYSGKKIAIVDPLTGGIREAEIFVAVLGASNFTYAEATWTQTLPDWIGAHVRMFRVFDGVPRLIVPDNLKSGVNRASFYDPEINRSYGMMASHYGVGVLPARPRRPKDKAKVENGVRFAQTCILGRLRRQTFFSLAEANAAIAQALDRINDHVMRRLGVSRRHLFQTVEGPALASLPVEDYEFAEWRFARVATDYHVEFNNFFYSVPHGLIRQQVDLRAKPGRSRYSTAASGLRLISADMADDAMGPTPTTCPAPTGDMPNGRRNASAAGPFRWDRRPRG